MSSVRQKLVLALVGLLGLGAAPPVRGESIYEPNNFPATAFELPGGQFVVSDDLNGNSGRADSILGLYDPTYRTLLDSNDNAPSVGNGFGSQLLGVPLRTNGSAYFRVTGAPDAAFGGSHTELGRYSISYTVHGPGDEEVKSHTANEWVTPGMVDNLWLNPDDTLLDWTGYTVDVTVNNVVGRGFGDSLDFFLFSGLAPFSPFVARLTESEFPGIIGLYDAENHRVATSVLLAGVPTIEGFADKFGRVKLGVTAEVDPQFTGEHIEMGQYTLAVVPEPASGLMLLAGAALVCLYRNCRRGGRRAGNRPRSA